MKDTIVLTNIIITRNVNKAKFPEHFDYFESVYNVHELYFQQNSVNPCYQKALFHTATLAGQIFRGPGLLPLMLAPGQKNGNILSVKRSLKV